ncbi:MAG: hypothetical protein Q9222_004474 [Ikaeria aurantiellina]
MENTIHLWCNRSLEAFENLQVLLQRPDSEKYDISQEVVSDHFGRFHVWAGNIGAGQQGRSSLDYRLRDASYIKDQVVSTLQYLVESLQEVCEVVSGSRLSYDQLPSDSDSSLSSCASDSARESSGQDLEVSNVDGSETELQQLQHSISTFISNLFKVSIIIRQSPAPHDRIVKSATIDTSHFQVWDERYVQDKYPHADAMLVKRLGLAITKRRKYLIYREQHRQKLSRQLPERTEDPVAKANNASRFAASKAAPANNEEQGISSDLKAQSVAQPSGTLGSTKASSFVPRNITSVDFDAVDQHSEAGTQTSVGSVTSTREDTLAIPPPPSASESGREFECPYCYTICFLRASDPWKRKREWSRHVLRDIQPYVCTFGGCSKVDTMFEKRRDWIDHELRLHRKEWCCNAPGHRAYGDRDEFQTHMRQQHTGSFDETNMNSLLERHLGRHMEVLATFALPSGYAGSRAGGSLVTRNAVRDAGSTNQPSELRLTEEVNPVPVGEETMSDNSFSSESLTEAPNEPSHEWGFLREEPSLYGQRSNPNVLPSGISADVICTWLSKTDQSALLQRYVNDKYVGTGNWFFVHPSYVRLMGAQTYFLLLEGLPGCGKTLLCSEIAQELDHQSVDYAFYFFPPSRTDQPSVDHVIRLLLSQLVRRSQEVPVILELLYQSHREERSVPSLPQLLEALQAMLQLNGKTVILLDSLDRCTTDVVKVFVRIAQEALGQGHEVSFMATSRISINVEEAIAIRPEGPFKHDLQWHNHHEYVIVPQSVVEQDIKEVMSQIFPKDLSLAGPEGIDASDILAAESEGIFPWAFSSVISLKLKEVWKTFAEVVAISPMYEERQWEGMFIRAVEQAGAEYKTYVTDILKTLSVAERGLTAEEIDGCLSYNLEQENWGKYRFSDRLDIWRQVPALLELVGRPGVPGRPGAATDNLGLVHCSFKRYLQSDHLRKGSLGQFVIDPSNAQKEIAERCVAHLLRFPSSDFYKSKAGWTTYAGTYWHKHAKLAADPRITSMCLRLLDSESPSFSHWTAMTRQDGNINDDEDGDFRAHVHYPSPLYYAALLGLYECAEELLDAGADIESVGGQYQRPLLAAIGSGEDELVDLLLKRGANPNVQNGAGTALRIAMGLDQCLIFKRLLQAGADLEARDETGSTPLHWAIWHGHKDCLRLLLDRGVDIEARDNVNSTALHRAIFHGRDDFVRVLLERGANLEAQDNEHSTPLHWAIQDRSRDCLSLLLDHGANVEARDASGNTPLHLAIVWSKRDYVLLLLDKGANTEARNDRGRTPLHVAMCENSIGCTLLLLDRGADIEARTIDQQRPLDLALRVSSKSISPLIKHGAIVDEETVDTAIESRDSYARKQLLLHRKDAKSSLTEEQWLRLLEPDGNPDPTGLLFDDQRHETEPYDDSSATGATIHEAGNDDAESEDDLGVESGEDSRDPAAAFTHP